MTFVDVNGQEMGMDKKKELCFYFLVANRRALAFAMV